MKVGYRSVSKRGFFQKKLSKKYDNRLLLKPLDFSDIVAFGHDWLAYCGNKLNLSLMEKELQKRYRAEKGTVSRAMTYLKSHKEFAIVGNIIHTLKPGKADKVHYWLNLR